MIAGMAPILATVPRAARAAPDTCAAPAARAAFDTDAAPAADASR
jgi:hypothetical protein